MFPAVEKVQYFTNGADATNAAVRVARAVTGNWNIGYIAGCYHGHDDWFIEGQLPARGVPQTRLLHPVTFGDVAGLRQFFTDYEPAAFIIEHGGREPAASTRTHGGCVPSMARR